jgi:nucleoside-diphosphate-sugar epimerase
MEVLVIGGTRNLGPGLVAALVARGDRVTVLNRGLTPDDLAPEIERLRADREDPAAFAAALAGRSFDAVVDTTLYRGEEARTVVSTLAGRCGHYVFLSTGQVYLVRAGLDRPFCEEDYPGPLLREPATGTRDHAEWRYGVDKRAAEDVLAAAFADRGFPATSLRLPMVHGERDHYQRLRGYLLRLADGGPLLVPEEPHLPIRHVDAVDVVRAVVQVLASGAGRGQAYNVGQDEAVPIEEVLAQLAALAGRPLRLLRPPRATLVAAGLLPSCSPFSNPWMSELDNRRGKRELGLSYTPFAATLERLVADALARPLPPPPGYAQRPAELALAQVLGGG